MLTSSWRSSGQDVSLYGLGMANSKSGYHNLLSSCQVLEFLGWPKCWFQEINIFTMYRHILLDLNLLLDIGIHHRLQICIVNSCHGSMSWSRVLLAGPLSHYPQCHNSNLLCDGETVLDSSILLQYWRKGPLHSWPNMVKSEKVVKFCLWGLAIGQPDGIKLFMWHSCQVNV